MKFPIDFKGSNNRDSQPVVREKFPHPEFHTSISTTDFQSVNRCGNVRCTMPLPKLEVATCAGGNFHQPGAIVQCVFQTMTSELEQGDKELQTCLKNAAQRKNCICEYISKVCRCDVDCPQHDSIVQAASLGIPLGPLRGLY